MLRTRIPCLVAVVLAIASCAKPPKPAEWAYGVSEQSQQSGVCTIHHVPLRRSTVYQYDVRQGLIHWSEAGYALSEKYPNVLDVSYARAKSRDYPDPVTQQFCPVCQSRFDAEIKSWRPPKSI